MKKASINGVSIIKLDVMRCDGTKYLQYLPALYSTPCLYIWEEQGGETHVWNWILDGPR